MPLKSNNINYYFIIRGGCNKKLLILNNLQCHYYEYSNKRKSTARLGRLSAPRGARPRSFQHEAMLHDEKSPVTFPLTL